MTNPGDHDDAPTKGVDTPSWRVVRSPRQDDDRAAKDSVVSNNQVGQRGESRRSGSKRGRAFDPADPRQKAMELLSRREHSHRELIAKLVARGFEADAAELTADEMATRGWQDDARYAETMARHRMMSGHGPLRIRADLKQHGIAAELIENALDACEVDWHALATEVLHRRFGTERADERKEIARRGAFLQRRGFDLDAIRHAMAQTDH